VGLASLSAAELRLILEGADDAIYLVDRAGIVVGANSATTELLGIPNDRLVGRNIWPFLDPADTHKVEEHVKAVFGGARRRYECAIIRADGARRLVSVSNTPMLEDGTVVRVLGVARDVTEERARASALERAEERYTRLVESAEDSIVTMDEEGNFTSVNKSAELMTGRSREQLLGTHFIEYVDPAERTVMWQMFAATLNGNRQRREVRYVTPDGAAGVATAITAPIYEGDRVTGVLGIARDVTEEHRLVEQVVRREKLAALGELVGGVSHEINTPLTGILAFSQLLLAQGELSVEGRHAAESIANEAKRAARIVGKLLSFARQAPPERLPTDLNQVLQDTLELRRYPHSVQGISVEVDLDPKLPVTWADPSQLQQVFLNLISNAEQAVADSPRERKITVRTRREADALVVAIGDTGRGIAPEHLPHIFNPFFTTKPRGIGTGLGLSISDGLVREHDGILRVHSVLGQGALFEVHLPRLTPRGPIPP
jgi:two-component system NtrC family sensor kinase